jgi:putative Mg2+ transporter-C (MgtC) family protein
VRGLTTAASIWIVAGIGMTVGAGMYDAALIGTGLVLFALFFMVRFEKKVFPARPLRKLEIVMRGEKVNTAGIFPLLEQHGIEIKSVGISQSYQAKTIRVKLTVQVPEGIEWNRFYREAGEMDGISKITLDEKL